MKKKKRKKEKQRGLSSRIPLFYIQLILKSLNHIFYETLNFLMKINFQNTWPE